MAVFNFWLDRLLKIGLTVFVLWNSFYSLPAMQERPLFVLWLLVCLFTTQLVRGENGLLKRGWYWVLIAFTVVSFGYPILNQREIMFMAGAAPPEVIRLGVIATLIVLYACFISVGKGLTIIIGVSLLYVFFGYNLPASWGGIPQFSINRVIATVYLSTNGIFGDVIYTLLRYVYLFILFGKLLEKVGALDFIMDFVQALMGRMRGGPALVSCVSSGLMGSINGSAVANVMVTGSISIPLMKRIGFKSEFAGGVEAASSTGGQFLPPVMGATAFLIAGNLGTAYLEVVRAAVIPAVLYFISILVAIYIYAIRNNIQGQPASELPKLIRVLKEPAALSFISGFVMLVVLLVMGYSAIYSVLMAIAALIVISTFTRQRLNPRKAVEVLADTADDFQSIGIAGSAIGIMVGVLLLSGLVLRFSSLVLALVGDNLMLVLMLTSVIAIIIGFGLPTVVTYIILAIMAVPLLIALDVNPMAAHLFVFFTGMVAMVTPPVALSAMAACSIARSDFYATSIVAMKLAMPALILPFFFVYNPALLTYGTPMEVALSVLTALIGVCCLAIALTGSVLNWRQLLVRTLLFAASILLIQPQLVISALTILALILLGSLRPVRRYITDPNAV